MKVGEIRKLQLELGQAQMDCTKLRQQLAESERACTTFHTALQDCSAERDALRLEVSNLQIQLRNDVQAACNLADTHRCNWERAEAECETLRTERDELKADLRFENNGRLNAEAQCVKLQAQLLRRYPVEPPPWEVQP